MKSRFLSTFVLLSSATFVVVGGCGGDDETDKAAPRGGQGGASGGSGGSTSKGGTTSRGGTDSGGDTGIAGEMGSPEPTGSTCQEAADCYAGLDTSELSGDPACIDKVEDGYCTHECEEDSDCCAVEGECRTGFKQVCASFEDSNVKYCFLSCEEEDLVPAGGAAGLGGAGPVDANDYCEREAHPRFLCRSTGGGDENRRVCLPDGGVAGAGGGPGGPPTGGAGGEGGVSSGGAGNAGGAGGAGGAGAMSGGGAGGAASGAGGAGGAP